MKLGEIITHRKGFITIDDSQVYKLCRVQLHRKGVVLRESTLGEKIKTKKQQVCKRGDFIVAEMDAKVGGYGFISDDLEGAIVSSHYFLFELNEEKVDRGYFAILVKFGFFQSQIKAVGSTNYAAVRPSDVLNWEVPVPGLKEQEQIKNRIEAVARDKDILVSEMDTQHSLLTALRQAILTEAVQGRLTAQWRRDNPAPEHARELLHRIAAEKARLIREKKIGKEKPLPPVTEEEMPYVVPDGWVWCRLGEVVLHIEAGKSPVCEPQVANLEEWGVLKISAITWDKFIEGENKLLPKTVEPFKDKEVVAGDFIMTRANTSDLIAKAVIVPTNVRKKLLLSDKTLRVAFASFVNKPYMLTYNNGPIARKHYSAVSSGTSDSMKNISRDNILILPIPLPPLSEQHAIVQKVSTLLACCDELEQQVRQSRSDLDVLMQAVLGEVFGAGA